VQHPSRPLLGRVKKRPQSPTSLWKRRRRKKRKKKTRRWKRMTRR
jgi:hypothetical protein